VKDSNERIINLEAIACLPKAHHNVWIVLSEQLSEAIPEVVVARDVEGVCTVALEYTHSIQPACTDALRFDGSSCFLGGYHLSHVLSTEEWKQYDVFCFALVKLLNKLQGGLNLLWIIPGGVILNE